MSDNLKRFKIRKSGSDLKNLPMYNAWNATKRSNPMFPEFAPKSVGGTASGFKFKETEGNCTWYAHGRAVEVWGEVIAYPHMVRNANLWLSTGFRKSDKPTVGSIVVFDDGNYGHVAFVEKIEGNKVIVSESSYSERGNDFLFKYGRTVDEICKMWGMKVLGYIPAPMALESYEEDEVKLSNTDIARLVIKGVYGNDPHRSKKLKEEGYDPNVIQDEVNKLLKPSKPVVPQKPNSNVGRSWKNKKIPLNLYSNATTSSAYKGKSRNVRTYKILAEAGKRVQIQHVTFDSPGNKVWVNKADGSIS